MGTEQEYEPRRVKRKRTAQVCDQFNETNLDASNCKKFWIFCDRSKHLFLVSDQIAILAEVSAIDKVRSLAKISDIFVTYFLRQFWSIIGQIFTWING